MDIRKILKDLQLTQAEIARRAKWNPVKVHRIVAGKTFPKSEEQRIIYELTGGRITPNDWVGINTAEFDNKILEAVQ